MSVGKIDDSLFIRLPFSDLRTHRFRFLGLALVIALSLICSNFLSAARAYADSMMLADATCNGTTDDSAVISSALVVAASSASKTLDASKCDFAVDSTLVIPPGVTLLVGSGTVNTATFATLSDHSAIIGNGKSVIRAGGAVLLDSTPFIVNGGHGQSGIIVSGLTLQGNRGTNRAIRVDGIRLVGVSGSEVSNNEIAGFTGNGVNLIDPVQQNAISFNDIRDTGTDGVNATHAIYVVRKSRGVTDGVTISANTIDVTSDDAQGAEGIKVATQNASGILIQNVTEDSNVIRLGASASRGGVGIEDFNSPLAAFQGLTVRNNRIIGYDGPAGAAWNGDWGISLGGANGGGELPSLVTHNYICCASGLGIEDVFDNTSVIDNTTEWTGASTINSQGFTRTFSGVTWKDNIDRNNVDPHHALLVINTNASMEQISIIGNQFNHPHGYGIAVVSNGDAPLGPFSISKNTIIGSVLTTGCQTARGMPYVASCSPAIGYNDVNRFVRIRGRGRPLLTTITGINPNGVATLATSARTSGSRLRATVGITPGTDAIIATNSGVVDGEISRNVISGWFNDGNCNNGWGIQVVNGAKVHVGRNRYVHVTCRVQAPRS